MPILLRVVLYHYHSFICLHSLITVIAYPQEHT